MAVEILTPNSDFCVLVGRSVREADRCASPSDVLHQDDDVCQEKDGVVLLASDVGEETPVLFLYSLDLVDWKNVVFSMNHVVVQTDDARGETAHDGFQMEDDVFHDDPVVFNDTTVVFPMKDVVGGVKKDGCKTNQTKGRTTNAL
jgi:hypothetical protein